MKRLSQHIEYLLHTRRVLTLPGVGSFHVMWVSAEFDRERHLFLPPRRIVEFSTQEVIDDGALLNSYQRREGINLNEAYNLVNEDLNELESSLAAGQTFPIKGIGELANEQGEIKLIEYNDSLKASEKIGLNAVNILTRRDKRAKSTNRDKGRTFNPDYYYIPIHKRAARIAASFLLVAIVGLFAILPMEKGVKSTSTATIVPVETEVVVSKTQEPEEPQLPEEPGRYCLIVGSFKTAQEAESFIAMARCNEFPLSVIEGKKMYWVSAASSSSKEEVQDVLKSEEFKQTGLKSWILDREKR